VLVTHDRRVTIVHFPTWQSLGFSQQKDHLRRCHLSGIWRPENYIANTKHAMTKIKIGEVASPCWLDYAVVL
jgi:hypothetical protein